MKTKNFFKKYKKTKITFLSLSLILLTYIIWLQIPTASNNRDWSPDQEVLSYAKINDNLITIYNIRNFTYNTTKDYQISYYNKTFDVNKLDSLWYIVEPFSEFSGAAHTFLSFGFEDEYLALSVEIRKEKGEIFSATKGLFKKYEIMYVFGDEEDLIKLRSNYRKDEVFLYPINTSKIRMQKVFLDVVNKINNLKENPEYYHSITNTCTTSLASHANAVVPNRIPLLKLGIIFPGYSDKLAYNLGIINTTLPYEEIRNYYKINERAQDEESDTPFSKRIRNFK